MALIKCTECGAEISNRAMACPKCGYPAGSYRWMKRILVIQAIIVVTVFALIYGLIGWFN
jgi:RNA polymerase subunit RPABC4/transcription elongation factor Spt4